MDKFIEGLRKIEARQDEIINEANLLKKQYDQLEEDKELLLTMMMHQENKKDRFGDLFKKQNEY